MAVSILMWLKTSYWQTVRPGGKMARWPGCQWPVCQVAKTIVGFVQLTSSSEEPAFLLKELISRVTENCCMLKVLRVTWEEGGGGWGAGERVGIAAK